jgi:hypothetical protein
MLRINTTLIFIALYTCCFPVLSQTEISAIARQAYHEQWIENPNLAISIVGLLDSLHLKREFSAFCPTDGSPAMLIRNKGASGLLSPPLSPRHPWEPNGWQENNGSWKGQCPGDSVSFIYTPTLQMNGCGPEPDLPLWIDECSEEFSPWYLQLETDLGPSNGSIYTKLGNDGVFNKPIIVVEGFDFGVGGDLSNHRHGSFGWHSLYGCDLDAFPGTEAYPILLDSLYDLGYDIVFIDFEQGTKSIEIKSKLVKKTIQLCNSFKQGNNALVIIGASMGGVVARHTLCLMEQQHIDHCTRLFVSIDSPHRGANISLGLNGLVSLLSTPSAEAAIFHDVLNSMAAKQLLISTPNGLWEYQEAMQMLDDMGLPKKSLNVAIANSHPEVEIELESNPLLDWSQSWWWLGTAHLTAHRHPTLNSGFSVSASCALPIDFIPFNGVDLWYEDEIYGYYPTYDLDIIPSSVGHHMRLFVDAINASGMMEISESEFQADAGFIPTWSALNCDLSEGEPSSFDFISHATQWNSPEEHVALTLHHRDLVLDKIIQGGMIAPTLLSNTATENEYTYNHLNPSKTWVGNTTIEGGGLLQLGEAIDLNTIESIEIQTLMCGTTLEINSGGTMNIGGELGLATATLTLTEGSYLYANNEGSLNIHPGSTIIVDKGAELVLDGSNLNMKNESKLEIKPGGILRFRNNANLIFEGNGCEISLQGKIINDVNSFSKITHGVNTSTLAQIKIEGVNATIDNKTNSKLTLEGNNHMLFNEESKCSIIGEGHLIIKEGTVHFTTASILHQTSHIQLLNSSINGSNFGTWECENRLKITESDWNRVKLNSSNTRLFLYENTFSRGVFTLNNTSFNVTNCTFYYSIFKSTDHTNINHFSGNIIESEHGLMGAAVEFISGTFINIQENIFSEGEYGLILDNSESSLTCNRFIGFDTAITLRGKNKTHMSPETGGGYNIFEDNRIHLTFDCSELPLLHQGKNTFGSYGTFCFSGTLKMMCNNTFNLEGNHFNVMQPNFNLFNCHPNCLSTSIITSINLSDAIVIVCNYNNTSTNNDGKKVIVENSGLDILGREINLDKHQRGIYFKRRNDGHINKYLQLD